jgi:hypothetical protein
MSRPACDIPEEMREADRLVTEALGKLAEHVDAVTILISKRREDGCDGTWRMVNGSGNFYARFGHAKEWVLGCESDMSRPFPTVPPQLNSGDQ